MTLRRSDGLRRKTDAEISAGDRNRATHTGTQAISTVSGLGDTLATKALAAAVGVDGDAANLGAFASDLIDDDQTVKGAIESVATNLAAASGSKEVGISPRGSGAVAPAINKSAQDWIRRGLDLADWEGDAESGRFAVTNDASDAVEKFLNAALELQTVVLASDRQASQSPNFYCEPLGQVQCRINGNGGPNNDQNNSIVIARQMPYLNNGMHLIGSPDTRLCSGADGLQLLYTINGIEAQTVFREGVLQPYGSRAFS